MVESSFSILNQSDSKLKPSVTWSRTFTRACGSSLVFLRILIGSSRYFPYIWLAVVVIWVWFYDNHSKCNHYSAREIAKLPELTQHEEAVQVLDCRHAPLSWHQLFE